MCRPRSRFSPIPVPMRWLYELLFLVIPVLVPAGFAMPGPAGSPAAEASVAEAPVEPGTGASGTVAVQEAVVPVLLVPGWGDAAPGVEPLRRRFIEAGWPESRVSTLSFRDPVGGNSEHAGEIGIAIDVLRGLTGAERVDVVAHSMGGLAVRHYLAEREEDPVVRRAVFLGTPHRGTVAAVLAWGDGGREMVPGSDFLMALNQAGPVPEGVEALALRTPLDLRIIPASSALLRGDGVENLEVCCPTHNQLVDDQATFDVILRFLTEGPRVEDRAGGVDPPTAP